MIFGGILKGVWSMYNPTTVGFCDFKCQNKSGITGFFKHLLGPPLQQRGYAVVVRLSPVIEVVGVSTASITGLKRTTA